MHRAGHGPGPRQDEDGGDDQCEADRGDADQLALELVAEKPTAGRARDARATSASLWIGGLPARSRAAPCRCATSHVFDALLGREPTRSPRSRRSYQQSRGSAGAWNSDLGHEREYQRPPPRALVEEAREAFVNRGLPPCPVRIGREPRHQLEHVLARIVEERAA